MPSATEEQRYAVACEASPSPFLSARAILPSDRTLIRDRWQNLEHFKPNIRRAKKAAAKLARRHAKAVAAGNHHLAHALAKKIAYSRSVALTSIMAANGTLPRRFRLGLNHRSEDPAERLVLGERRNRERLDILDMARRLSIWEPCAEPIRVKAQDKPGKFRPRITQNFGLENRARQIIVRELVRPHGLAWTMPNQFGVFRGGRDAAMDAVQQNLTGGFTTVYELDIADCYMNLDPVGFAECMGLAAKDSPMRLPRKIIRNLVATHGDANIRVSRSTPRYSEPHLAILARLGPAQGSLLSPMIAEMMLAFIVGNLPDNEDRRIVVKADNILIMTKDRRTAEATASSLHAILQWHPAGRLRLHSKQGIRRASDGFEFLGYRIRYRKGVLTCVPRTERKAKGLVKLYRMLRNYRDTPSRTLWRDMRRLVKGFCSGYCHWTDPSEWTANIRWTVAHVFGLEWIGQEIAAGLTAERRPAAVRPRLRTRPGFEDRRPPVFALGALTVRRIPLYLL